MGGSNTGGGAGGNTGADAGFFISEQRKKEKINESGYGADYQGDVNPQKKQKKKTVTTTNNDNGGGGNQVVQAPKVISPTTAEVSQAAPEVTAEEARASANELIKKRRRGRGRSLSMLQTSSQGLDNKGLTLGKPTLLG